VTTLGDIRFAPYLGWAIRVRLQVLGGIRKLALFDLGVESKLRACDELCRKVGDDGVT
jgi:hypothetical protein